MYVVHLIICKLDYWFGDFEWFEFILQVMVWKSNFDCAEGIDDFRLQHKAAPSLQAVGSSTAQPPLTPSEHRSQVRSVYMDSFSALKDISFDTIIKKTIIIHIMKV